MNRALKCSVLLASMLILGCGIAMAAEKAPAKSAPKKSGTTSSKKTAKKAPAKPEAEAKPTVENAAHKLWSLRDQFTFRQGDGCIDYSAETAEWRVRVKDPSAPQGGDVSGTAPEYTRVVAESAGFSITFADGSVLKSADLGFGKETHDLGDNADLGAGYHYDVTFPANKGLQIIHRLSTLQNWPFLMLSIIIENQGAQPVVITEVDPVLLGPDALHDWSKETQLANRHGYACGGRLVYGTKQPSTLAILFDPTRNAALSFAMPVANVGAGEVAFLPSAKGWQGNLKYRFEPGLRIAPGTKVALDPLWMSYGMGNPAKIARYWGWAQSVLSKPKATETTVPRAWLTTTAEGGLDKLLAEAGSAKTAGVTHGLVGAAWEEQPGALRGKAPAYPKNIGSAADAIRKAGLTPGITLDPLCMEAKGQPADAFVAGETAWLNPTSQEGTAKIATRVKSLIDKGFEFLAVRSSEIPNEALTQFGLSRSAADAAAMSAVAQAAPKTLVTATSCSELPAERDAWLAAAGDVVNGTLYGLVGSPLRLDNSQVGELSDEQCAAFQLYPGTIELTSAPKGGGHGLAWALGGGVLPACPLDLASAAPRLWQQRLEHPADEGAPVPVLAFAGAPAWPLTALLDAPTEGASAGRIGQNAFEILEGNSLPASAELGLYTVFRTGASPSFLAAIQGAGPAAAPKTQWDAGRNSLHGAFPHALAAGSSAYVHVPEGWKPKSASAGKSGAKFTVEGRVMIIRFEDSATEFEAKFEKP